MQEAGRRLKLSSPARGRGRVRARFRPGRAKAGDSGKGGPMPETVTGYAPSACKT